MALFFNTKLSCKLSLYTCWSPPIINSDLNTNLTNLTLRNVRVKKACFLYRTQAMSQNVTNYYSCHSRYSCSSKNEYLVVANSRLQPALYSLIACRDIGQRSQWQITCYGADVGFCCLGQACVWGNVLKYK